MPKDYVYVAVLMSVKFSCQSLSLVFSPTPIAFPLEQGKLKESLKIPHLTVPPIQGHVYTECEWVGMQSRPSKESVTVAVGYIMIGKINHIHCQFSHADTVSSAMLLLERQN